MDIQYINNVIIQQKYDTSKLVQNGDTISKEEIEFLSTLTTDQLKIVIVPISSASVDGVHYNVELSCGNCGKMYFGSLTKTKLLKYINFIKGKKNIYVPICDECKAEAEKRRRETIIQNEQKQMQDINSCTEKFIEHYLAVGYDFVEEYKNVGFREIVNYYSHCDEDEIANYIKSMDYNDFLDTPYWKALARQVRKKSAYRCQLCNAEGKLSVHHRTYENHGYEYYAMEDLICLCDDCHAKYHEKGKYNGN